MSKRLMLVVTLVLGAVLTACSSSDSASTGEATAAPQTTPVPTAQPEAGIYRALTVDEFADIVANRADNYTIINVHIPYAGEIEGTDANIAYNDLDALTAALPDKNAPIILYCRSGRMSEEASQALIKLGYTQVWDVSGGMNAWQESGRQLVSQ